ncbi:MAG TPA: hypothetical protein VGT61_09140 [Thermomicrobiales bacterium]|jgi:uncharacterized protein YggT (Ycf19 family)|nr:hypothetical protein [Thermomicrobiales bacterium]
MLPLPQRDTGSGASSQIAFEVVVNLYAAFVVLFLTRAVLLVAQVDERVWIGRTVYRFTDPVVAPLGLVPGASRYLIGSLSLADFTILAIVVLIPLGIALRRGTSDRPTGF